MCAAERRPSGGDRLENPLALSLFYHVAIDDVAEDTGDEVIASWLGREPAGPFQLIQCLRQAFPLERGFHTGSA
jgi:hypothetical protein